MIVPDRSTGISSFVGGGTIQWMSPELLNPEDFDLEGRPTKESDCYALGMVIYEVLSGRTPFAPSNAPPVIWKVLNGERPERPRGEEGVLFTDDLWGLLQLCWKHQPDERTSAKTVLLCLGRASLLAPFSRFPPSEFEVGFQPNFNVEGTVTTCSLLEEAIGAGTDELSNAPASDESGTFSPFRGLIFTFTFNHLFGYQIGPSHVAAADSRLHYRGLLVIR